MDDKEKNAYVAGFVFTLASAIFWGMAFTTGWNLSGLIMSIFGLAFGGLGIGSFWKPMSIGQVAIQIAENYRRQGEASRRDTQEMSDSPEGKQVIASEGGKVDMSTHYHSPSVGDSNKQTKVCLECLGDGKVPCDDSFCHEGYFIPPGLDPGDTTVKCEICRGMGVILCKNCEGEGRIDA